MATQTTPYTWRVTENNGGGLTLYVWENDTLIYGHAGYEYAPENLRADIDALKNGEDPREWDGNDITSEDIVRTARERTANDGYMPGDDTDIFDADGNIIPLTEDEYYDDHETTNAICDQKGPVDYDRMGGAGRSVFYPDGDPEDQE